VYEELGEREDAIEWLGRALEAGYPLPMIEDYDLFEKLPEDPRYIDLLATYTKQDSGNDDQSTNEGGTP